MDLTNIEPCHIFTVADQAKGVAKKRGQGGWGELPYISYASKGNISLLIFKHI